MKISGGEVKWQETAKGRVESLWVEREVALTKSLGLVGEGLGSGFLRVTCRRPFIRLLFSAALLYSEGLGPAKF